MHCNKKKTLNKKISSLTVLMLSFFIFPVLLFAQQTDNAMLLKNATLENCIQYALQNNPQIKNAKVNEDITETIIKSKLADWYPQISFDYNIQHNFQLPTFNINGNITRSGYENTSGFSFGLTQNIFNRDALLASQSAKAVRLASDQNTQQQKIELAVAVSKAFYDVILTVQQLKVIQADIDRTNQSLQDAYYQYQSGLVDKTDYKRATIALNNAKSQKKSGEEALKSKTAYMKELMGLNDTQQFDLRYDTLQMENEIYLDTTQTVNYNNRIEIQQLETQKKLQQFNLQYYKWSFLPNLSAFGNYNLNFQNDQFSKMYGTSYPNSYAGLTLSIPIFQGGKRVEQIKQAQFQITLVDNDILSQKNSFNTQYETALASYKSNLYNYFSLKENFSLASEVYDVLRLQYRSGVKTYLDVITAETDLRTAQISYYNALYEVLSSKIDVEKSLGNISY